MPTLLKFSVKAKSLFSNILILFLIFSIYKFISPLILVIRLLKLSNLYSKLSPNLVIWSHLSIISILVFCTIGTTYLENYFNLLYSYFYYSGIRLYTVSYIFVLFFSINVSLKVYISSLIYLYFLITNSVLYLRNR